MSFQGCQVPALPGNEWDLRVLVPGAVQCFVLGKSWAAGYKAGAKNAFLNKEAKSFT